MLRFMTSTTSQPAADDLDEFERRARDYLTPILGGLRLIDRPGGPPGVHDFEADLIGGSVAAIEVTSQVDRERRGLESNASKLLSEVTVSGSNWAWWVLLAPTAQVNAILPADLVQLLRGMDADGTRHAYDHGDYRDPLVARLRALGIETIHAMTAKPGSEGTVVVEAGTYGGFGWDGPRTDAWLADLLRSKQGLNKLGKLGKAQASERHLVVVLDSFSEAGLGIPLALTARRERGMPKHGVPSIKPPEPVTHLWLLPMSPTREGLRWTRTGGWAVVPGDSSSWKSTVAGSTTPPPTQRRAWTGAALRYLARLWRLVRSLW